MMEALDRERHVDDGVVEVDDSDSIEEGSFDVVREIIVSNSGWGESVKSCNWHNFLLQVNGGQSGDCTTQAVTCDNQASICMLIFQGLDAADYIGRDFVPGIHEANVNLALIASVVIFFEEFYIFNPVLDVRASSESHYNTVRRRLKSNERLLSRLASCKYCCALHTRMLLARTTVPSLDACGSAITRLRQEQVVSGGSFVVAGSCS